MADLRNSLVLIAHVVAHPSNLGRSTCSELSICDDVARFSFGFSFASLVQKTYTLKSLTSSGQLTAIVDSI
jgi:hypothetical protein